MSARRKTYDEYVREDLDRIEIRAVTLYALSDPVIPWPAATEPMRRPFVERAARELWEEGALLLDPSAPYYERADQ